MRNLLHLSVIATVILLVGAPHVEAKSIAMEHDGLPGCVSADDMGLGTVGSGVTETFDLYFHDLNPAFSVNCTFCIQDSLYVDLGSISYTFSLPGPWTLTPIVQRFPFELNPEIAVMYPRVVCWLVQATDFTFSAPWSGGKHGAFQFTTTGETCIGFVMDGSTTGSGVFFTDFSTAAFDQPGETCDAYVCPTSATEVEAWGGIKTLFR